MHGIVMGECHLQLHYSLIAKFQSYRINPIMGSPARGLHGLRTPCPTQRHLVLTNASAETP